MEGRSYLYRERVGMLKNNKNVSHYVFGQRAVCQLEPMLSVKRESGNRFVLFLVDHFFRSRSLVSELSVTDEDELVFVDTTQEPKTSSINELWDGIRERKAGKPAAVVAVGGGGVLDTGKAVSILIGNGGLAENYQGWDLVKQPGVYKIGIPTLSGTGAETSRTCVMTNPVKGIKIGMNSDFSVYDQLLLDPELTETVPRNQYFYTGTDTYIHCVESLNGRYRNAIGDALAREALKLTEEVFLSPDMMTDENRSRLMVASYLGGCAIAHGLVGLVHPFSAGLSVVLGLHHGVANCVALKALGEFYPQIMEQFDRMTDIQKIGIPAGVCADLTPDQMEQLYQATVVHAKPLANALGEDFHRILTREKVFYIFKRM